MYLKYFSTHLKNYDPFHDQKMNALSSCEDAMEILGKFLIKYFNNKDIELKDLREDLPKMIKCALWGNRCDLSQTGGDAIAQTESPLKLVDSLQDLMLVDESYKIVDFLCASLDDTNNNKILGNYLTHFVFMTNSMYLVIYLSIYY